MEDMANEPARRFAVPLNFAIIMQCESYKTSFAYIIILLMCKMERID